MTLPDTDTTVLFSCPESGVVHITQRDDGGDRNDLVLTRADLVALLALIDA
ncbi:hypothetical protein [Polymorphobacter arshaanensis]|uniref:hypothetical protein n=1 Tax=Glacieibacterium arshaanense TaxID=2511025 RepID=UPI00140A0A9B|nr:hypothetical protein [Polymorphobacter arshaanensis]